MKTLDKIGTYQFTAEPFHCDFSKKLFMGHLGNHLLNAADFHASDRGFGMTYLNPEHKTWVLSRLAIEMYDMPAEYTKFNVSTWIEGAMKYFTHRNFRVTSAADGGKVYGYGRSIWAMIDTDSRQPADILAIKNVEITHYIDTETACPIATPSRVKMGNAAKIATTIDTHYSDVDVNGHINSVKYIEHVLDLFDLPWHKSHRISRLDIAYVAESYCGDKLNFYREDTAEDTVCVKITKSTPDEKEVEVCRCQVTFSPK